ncbi:MAG: MMPL family transporter [Candidatus Izemoplasmatales bacterium]|nr:MMPL family transporter [Candidatus Izemoplasmatales bacterium]
MAKILGGKGKWLVIVLFLFLTIAAGISIFFVRVNYDLTEYLPDDSQTATGVEIMENVFGDSTSIQIMVNNVIPTDGTNIVTRLREIDGVDSVVWLGDATNPLTPIETIDESLLNRFYIDGSLLFSVTIACGTYDTKAETIIQDIRDTLDGTEYAIRGEVLNNIEARKIASREIFKVLLIVVPLCVVVLLVSGKSWFEPILILGNLAVAVVFNMGTNALLGSISYITMTMTMALQLALSMDYSLFLLHRYQEERDRGVDIIPAIAMATKKTFTSITGSALTTIAGFLALCLMQYSIGTDLGIVLSKGVFCSYITSIFLLPILLFFSASILEKAKHRPLFHRKSPAKPRTYRARYVFTAIFAILAIGSYFLQNQNSFIYGNSSAKDPNSVVTADNVAITERFGSFNPVVVLTKNSSIPQETAFIDSLSDSEYIVSTDALSLAVDDSIPREMLPESLVSVYVSGEYTRIIVYLASEEENEDMYAATKFLNEQANDVFDTYYLVGFAPATAEIRTTVLADSKLVLWVTFLAIVAVVLVLFRSLSIPVLLTIIIQGAVWFNFAIGYLQDRPVLFIGYLIVSALQMGGTVDYGILLSTRYLDFRKTESPEAAMQKATSKSTLSILTSSLVLAFAGFTEGIVSAIPAVSAIGNLIGRGAILSALVTLVFLPYIMLTFDKIIQKTTFHSKRGESL